MHKVALYSCLFAAIAAFLRCNDPGPTGTTTITTTSTPPVAASVISLNTQVIDQNSVFWTFSWIARISANRAGQCFLRTKYFDAVGFELYEGIEGLDVRQGTNDYTGQDLIDPPLATRVVSARGEISSCS